MKYLDHEEYTAWKQTFDEANLTMGGGNARAEQVRGYFHCLIAMALLLCRKG